VDLGPFVSLTAIAEIEDDTKDYNASVHDARPVHGHRCDRNRRRKKGENQGNEGISSGIYIDRKTQSAELPRSEGDWLFPQSFENHNDDGD